MWPRIRTRQPGLCLGLREPAEITVIEAWGGKEEASTDGVAPCEQSATLAHGNMVAEEAEPGMAAHRAELPTELP